MLASIAELRLFHDGAKSRSLGQVRQRFTCLAHGLHQVCIKFASSIFSLHPNFMLGLDFGPNIKLGLDGLHKVCRWFALEPKDFPGRARPGALSRGNKPEKGPKAAAVEVLCPGCKVAWRRTTVDRCAPAIG